MKKIVLSMLLSMLIVNVWANDLVPVALQSSTPSQTWFYNLEDVVFDADDSYVPNGYIMTTKWYINGVYQAIPNHFDLSVCFALPGSPANGCYQLASGQTTVQVKLEVQSNHGYWHSQTKTYTIQEHKGRKYFVKDHLGNVRTTVNRDGNVLGYDDYYPFGLVMPDRSSNSANPNDRYKFTGHERDDEAGLTLDYMMARNYDPIIGRFLQIDPMLESSSPYSYVDNDPINFLDPNGKYRVYSGYTSMNGGGATAFFYRYNVNQYKSISTLSMTFGIVLPLSTAEGWYMNSGDPHTTDNSVIGAIGAVGSDVFYPARFFSKGYFAGESLVEVAFGTKAVLENDLAMHNIGADEVAFNSSLLLGGMFIEPDKEGYGNVILNPQLGNALLKNAGYEMGSQEGADFVSDWANKYMASIHLVTLRWAKGMHLGNSKAREVLSKRIQNNLGQFWSEVNLLFNDIKDGITSTSDNKTDFWSKFDPSRN